MHFTNPVCSWDGVTCDARDNSTVVGLELANSDLLGTLPSTIGLLTALQTLNLRRNILMGTLPVEIAAMPSLEWLDLEGNQLKGRFPSSPAKGFPSATKLVHLDLSHNQLYGTIPADFGKRNTALEYLDLQRNKLSGFLPYGLEDLSNLHTLSLSRNQLSGTLPNYIAYMDNLRFLYLDQNSLVGTLPPSWGKGIVRTVIDDVPNNSDNNNNGDSSGAIANNTLQEVWLQSNDLSGTLPVTLTELSNLSDLYVDSNKLTGTVPQELCQPSLNVDFFQDNPNKDDRNLCDSVTCQANTVADDGVWPCLPCTSSIQSPYLGRTDPCPDVTESTILAQLVEGTLDIQESACLYEGVVCDEQQQHVVEIRFPHRGLTGTIPDSLGLLSFLRVLDLSHNKLTGFLPSGLRFAPLETLRVDGNRLKGIVPPLLCTRQDINNNTNVDGSVGDCSHIACPVGTYSTVYNGTTDCLLCPTGMYLASDRCLIDGVGTDDAWKDNVIDEPSEDTSFGVPIEDDVALNLIGDDDDNNNTHRHQRKHLDPAQEWIGSILVVTAVLLIVWGVLRYFRKNNNKNNNTSKQFRMPWSQGKPDLPAGNIAAWEAAQSSLPHHEEIRFIERRKKKRKKSSSSKKRKGSKRSSGRHKDPTQPQGPQNWLTKRLNTSYHYLVSLRETEPVPTRKGEKEMRVSMGELDDVGWRERDSILEARELEAHLQSIQARSALQPSRSSATSSLSTPSTHQQNVPVWEYPDPLEYSFSYATTGSEIGGGLNNGSGAGQRRYGHDATIEHGDATARSGEYDIDDIDDDDDDDDMGMSDDLTAWLRDQDEMDFHQQQEQQQQREKEVWLDVPRP